MDVRNDEELRDVLEDMTHGFSAARMALKSIQQTGNFLDASNGISLLSLKHHTLLFYLQSLVLVAARRTLGDSLAARSNPPQSFSSISRSVRGNHSGDLVDSIIENRIVLEKIDLLESKMRYQIEKLVRIADEPTPRTDDPLAFKPNPLSLAAIDTSLQPEFPSSKSVETSLETTNDGLYRPPRLAPMPYVEKTTHRARQNRPPIPSALATLTADPSQPFLETTSGLGGAPALASGRAQYLKRLKDFEEENFTRVVMKKSDAKRRARDEEDLALGGDLGGTSGARGSRAGGLNDEFSDVLRSVSRLTGTHGQGDGYEELRKRGRKLDLLERSRTKQLHNFDEDAGDSPRPAKRTRFELDTKVAKKKLRKR